MNSRVKGKRGELEAAKAWMADVGLHARRTQQYNGKGKGDIETRCPDDNVIPIHLEVKRNERLNINDAMAQAKRDAKAGEVPLVLHRKNKTEWLVSLPLTELRNLCAILSKYPPVQNLTPICEKEKLSNSTP